MKKVIAIVAVVVIAILGLSSYNDNEIKKNDTKSMLLAQLTNGGTGAGSTTQPQTPPQTGGGNKKQD